MLQMPVIPVLRDRGREIVKRKARVGCMHRKFLFQTHKEAGGTALGIKVLADKPVGTHEVEGETQHESCCMHAQV